MKEILLVAFLFAVTAVAQTEKPLRIFIRAGEKTHGPGQHDHPRFLAEWKELLNQRGARADGAMNFPSAAQLEATDVLVMYAAEAGTISTEHRASLDTFLKQGGGMVVIHDAVCGTDPQWFKTVVGGAWEHKRSKWYEGEVGVYFVDTEHPITRGISNFDLKDEIYHDLHLMPGAKILASSFHSVFVIAPQMWVYENHWAGATAPYRAFVCLQGHEYSSFNLPHFRALLLRGIAWAGKRANVDSLCSKEELASLKYPEGGPTAPNKAASKFVVHPEFDINLVASEPLIEKAMSLDWDPQGRLWVVETPEYPGGRTINTNDAMVALWSVKNPEQVPSGEKQARPARDRISWLEDLNKDGVMDKKHVFADGLELVTSLVFYKDGVVVAQAPEILWLRDTNGDGKCDLESEKVVLYTGFGTRDTHAVINNLRWGMDGWIYSAIGYSAGDPISAESSKKFGRVTAGVIRFKPDGSALEQYASGSCNTWGFDFAPDGEAFYTTATCGEHLLHVVMPEKILARGNVGGLRASAVVPDHQKIFPSVHHTRPAYVQIDWVGQFTAAAGCCIYNGGAWPKRFDGSHFCSETTMSFVHNDFPKPNGVTYVARKEPGREETEFIAGTDLWFRPIHTRVGPDGALYIIDFYNQAAIHNDTRGPKHGANNAAVRPDRDHHFGRIWRVQHKQTKQLPPWKLDPQTGGELVTALEHPNGWVRQTANRLLTESGNESVVSALTKLLEPSHPATARINALWVLHNIGVRDDTLMATAINDDDPIVRKNALRVVAERDSNTGAEKLKAVQARLNDTDPRARLNAMIALGSFAPSLEIPRAVVSSWPALQDKYIESAAIGVAAKEPLLFVDAALAANNATGLDRFVRYVVRVLAQQGDAAQAVRLVATLAKAPTDSDPLKAAALESLAQNLKENVAPTWSGELRTSFNTLLGSPYSALPAAALPLIVRWNKSLSMTEDVKPIVRQMILQLSDGSLADDQRGQVAVNLLGVRKMDAGIISAIAKLLGSDASPALQKRVLEALGAIPDGGAPMVALFPKLSSELQEAAFEQVVRRSDSALALIDALSAKEIDLLSLGPANLHRLRTHADKVVATRANTVIDELRGPEQKEKDALIAQFKPAVEQSGGNVENGRKLLTANCASCHKFNGEGKDLAPDLTGMGVHGAHELLVHILDPNRVVEPNFVSVSIETKDEQIFDGMVARENKSSVTLRNASGEMEIRTDNIKGRRKTGLSLMPSGFESLGGEGLRDLLAYLCAGENKYRLIDLKPAFTADSRKGIYISQESTSETLQFKKFGLIKAGEVPFEIVHPARTTTGYNVAVLKGGSGFAKNLPQKVEVANIGLRASRLHFLGGVGGWAWPCCGENKNENLPAAKVTVHYADGQSEEITLKNGVEIVDYVNASYEVPGSKQVPDLVARGQVRWFTKPLQRRGVIQRISLESFDNVIAPTFVAITAEVIGDEPGVGGAGGGATVTDSASATARVASPAVSAFKWGQGIRTLIVGGGNAHDFGRWFNQVDSTTLSARGLGSINYTEQPADVLPALKDLDVLYLSNNQPLTNVALRRAIFDFAEAGKGLLLVHPALWYNWKDWPEYNRQLVGGGTRKHDPYGEFEVRVEETNHPIMAGVPPIFKITDELYHFQRDESGAPIQILATGRNLSTGTSYPVVWITKHSKARIVCITLGHDGMAHEHPAFLTLLQNSLRWMAEKSVRK